MRFHALLGAVPGVLYHPAVDAEVTAPISEDSRQVQPGGVFVARRGGSFDSHEAIDAAVAAGAVAVVGERPRAEVAAKVPYAQVKDARQALGTMAAAYHGFPSRRLTMIGVTGTDGKTTTTNLIYRILRAAGKRAGMISTISAVIGDQDMPTGLHVTTPTAPEIQAYLRRMVDAGLTHCVLEVTSHGLAQGRVTGVDFDVAVMTNVTHEHLDFHGTFENYRAAKRMLFEAVRDSEPKPDVLKAAVINYDDANAEYFLGVEVPNKLTYSLDSRRADIYTQDIISAPAHTQFTLNLRVRTVLARVTIDTQLVGEFNVQNIMAAAGAGMLLQCSMTHVKQGIAAMPLVPGRMERVHEGQDFVAIVDFAHTPNALEKALEAARKMTQGQVIAVFGSAGLRDVEKRRLMAEVGAELADVCILTAEDPRTESLERILEMMAAGARAKGGIEGRTFYRIPDRGAALAFACALANSGDVVIACGKGHEQSMCFGTVEYEWDDRSALRAALQGTPIKTLPTMQARGKW